MYWLDFILLFILGMGVLWGAWKGLLWQVAGVVSIFIAVYASMHYHEVAAGWMLNNIEGLTPWLLKLLSYVVTFFLVLIVCIVITHVLDKMLRAAQLKLMDRTLGALVGLLLAGLFAGVPLLGLALYSSPQTDAVLARSNVAPVILKGMKLVIIAVPDKYKARLSETLDRIKTEGVERLEEQNPLKRPDSSVEP